MKYLNLLVLTLIAIVTAGCDSGPESSRGFSLPEGYIIKGKAVFFKYQCLSCHQLKGVEQPDIVGNPDLSIRLGGKSNHATTYAELVTPVINPSHRFASGYRLDLIQQDGESKVNFIDVMTATELVDLVAFLQPKYELVPTTRINYQHYTY
jgi:hypothetical protein